MDKPVACFRSSCLEFCSLQVRSAGPSQVFLVAQGSGGAGAALTTQAAYEAITKVLKGQGLTIVHERLFGSLSVQPEVMAAREAALRVENVAADGPLTYIQGHPPWGEGLSGVIIHAIACHRPEDRVWTLRDQGRTVGRGWRQGETTYFLFQNLQGLAGEENGSRARSHQARCLIRKAASLLEAQGASYRNVIRTWFYLEDILTWYSEFNQARNAVYEEFGMLPDQRNGRLQLPASTGIQGLAPGGAACALDLLAVGRGPDSQPLARQLSSPTQPEPLTYGSAFTRGVLLHQPDISLVQVSGTAAIDEQGQSLYPGDIQAQVDYTFEKVAALIGKEGATLTDIVAACVFVKRPEDALVYQDRAAAWDLENLPAVVMVADICRPELLFEIDAELAFSPGRREHAEK
jgi:enamine deaminase RidA (YjgF/YER057c/UK114 family)